LRHISENASDFLTKLVPFVENDGARNLTEVSRHLSIPYTTLRTRMMNLKGRGISVVAVPDVEKLGLERIRASFFLACLDTEVKPIFRALHQKAGLRSYARSLIDQEIDCEFAIPKGRLSELGKLFSKLEELKLVQKFRIHRPLWKEVLMLKTESFDYSKGEWDVDFSRITGDPSVRIPIMSAPTRFDYNDLILIKNLELDSWLKTVELARKTKLGVGDAIYHLNRHVFGKKLIKHFRLCWDGRKDAWLKHSILGVTLVFDEISDEDAREAISVLTSNPFTWSHMRMEDGTYLSEAMIPISQFLEDIQFLSKQLRKVHLQPKFYMKDWSSVSTYTIPYMLYNRVNRAWKFNAEKALESTMQMVNSSA
jgi:hypothetical protein